MLRAWVLLATMCLIGSILIGALVPGWPWDKLITEGPVGGIIMFVVFGGLLFFDRSKARRILGGEEAGAAESSSAPPPSDAGGIPPGLGAG
jgi:F0F1-type ATP synthase assembly protein I